MNHVERFKAVMNFQPVDRLPRIEWAVWWDKTVERWRTEGVPPATDLCEYFGLDPYRQVWFGPRKETLPAPSHHGAGIIANADDYRKIKQHLYPPHENNIEYMREWAARQARGEMVVWITLDGFFWFPRTLFGIEPHLYAFYDQPELMHQINQDLVDSQIRLLRALGKVCRPTFMTFGEDMSYNHGPMLSKKLFDEFIAPCYRQMVPVLQEMGVVTIVDSDGDVTEMVPWLTGVGLDGVLPLERQAGVDAARIRADHPRFRMIGHFDKMTMTRGEAAMRAEFERLLPVMRSGGFIPSVDHQTPPGVSLAEYRIYLRLLNEYSVTGARRKD